MGLPPVSKIEEILHFDTFLELDFFPDCNWYKKVLSFFTFSPFPKLGFCKMLRLDGFDRLGADFGVVLAKVLIFTGLSIKGVFEFEEEE